MKRMKKLESKAKHVTPPIDAVVVLTAEQKLKANGEPYLQLLLGQRTYGNRWEELTLNKFFNFDKQSTFEQKINTVAAFAESFPVGCSCYCAIGHFTGRDGKLHLCATDVFKTKEDALSTYPKATILDWF